MDLEPILIRAEALFRRFQRTVESIDKKANVPLPRVRQRPTGEHRPSSTSQTVSAGISTGADTAVTPIPANADPKGKGRSMNEESPIQQKKVISPELRGLLSRKVEVLPRKEVRKKGEGLKNKKGG
jgi:hypothetical protein